MAGEPWRKIGATLFIVMTSMKYVATHVEVEKPEISEEGLLIEVTEATPHPKESLRHKEKHKKQFMGLPIEFDNLREIEKANEIAKPRDKKKELPKKHFKGLAIEVDKPRKIKEDKDTIAPKISLLIDTTAATTPHRKDSLRQAKAKLKRQYEGLPIEFDNLREIQKASDIMTPTDKRKVLSKRGFGSLPIKFENVSEIEEAKTSVSPKLMTTTTRVALDRRFRRIYNPDEVASIEEFPYMAALLVNNELWCGAVIIDRDKVLSAAHCLQLQYNNRFFREYVKMLTVRVGSTNATAGGDLLRVTEIFFHPNYKPQTLEFNYAVLKLHKNMTLGRSDPYIEKIKYARDQVVPVDNKIMFLGWGSVLGIDGAGGQELLQKVTLPVYDTADCQEIYGRKLVTRSNFCAGFITIPKNVCNHDAGGPAVMDGRLIGVLSFSSKRCDQPDQPAVFSTVGTIANWLDNIGKKKITARSLMQ